MTLAGTLAITTAPGYQPVVGTTYPIISGATLTGTFSAVNGVEGGNGTYYRVSYTATGVTLTVVAEPSMSIGDVSQAEGDSGTSVLTFTVTLNAASDRSASVDFSTADGTATAGQDYQATSGTLTIPPGSTSGTIPVTIYGDTQYEPDETFTTNLSNAQQATLNDASATGTIVNDDPQSLNADLVLTTSSPADVVADPTQDVNNIDWTLTVNNLGPASASAVTIADTIPAGTEFVSATPSQGTCSGPDSTGLLTCDLGSVPANPAAPPTVDVTVKPLDPSTLTNLANVTATENDPNQSNNSVSDSVAATPEQGITYLDVNDSGFAVPSSTVGLGSTVQYTFLGTLVHHLTDQSGLIDSGSSGPDSYFRFEVQAAGQYVVSDTAVAGTSTVTAAPTVKKGKKGTYTITWSLYGATPAGYGYDVTVTGPKGTVTLLTPTRAEKTAVYTPTDGKGKYTVKARIRNNTTKRGTGYASAKFTVK